MYININIYIYIYFNIYIQDDIHDIINLWHGKLQFNLSPNVFLKQKVIAYSLKEDFLKQEITGHVVLWMCTL